MQLGFAALALLLGASVYALDRVGGLGGLELAPLPALVGINSVFGPLGGSLPAMAHVISFSLFTACALPDRRIMKILACLSWAGVNLAFELLQHPRLGTRVLMLLEPWAGPSGLARSMVDYGRRGVFDGWDVAFIMAGAAIAYLVLTVLGRKPEASS